MRQALTRAALATAALVLLGCAAAWSFRVPLVTWTAIRLLERQQLGPIRIVIDTVDLHEFRAHDVSLRGGAIRADEVTASYDPLELAVAHLRRVALAGVNILLATGPNGIEAGGRPLGVSAGTGGGATVGALRIDAISVPDAQIAFESPAGLVQSTISATFVLAEASIHSTAFAARISAPVAGTHRAAHFEARDLMLEPRADGGLRLRVSQATLMPEDVPWAAQAIDGVIDWQPPRATAQLAVGRLVDRQQPMRVAPLGLTANATVIGPDVDFELNVNAGAKSATTLNAKGRHDRSSNSGSASISMEPMEFHRGGVQPADIFPALGGTAEDVDGAVSLAGSLRWDGAVFSPDLVVRLKNLAFTASVAKVSDLNGAIKIVRLWPPATPPGQTLAATIETAGLPPARLRLDGQLTATPAFKIEHITIGVAGGEITASPFVIDSGASPIDTTLQVHGVDFAEVIELLGIDGLSGAGQLDGRIPLRLQDSKMTVSAGRLVARAPGLLRYKPAKASEEIAAAGESVALALQALSDFHYETLTLDLDKSPGGEGTVFLRLKGGNPAVLQDQVFNINIRIDSNFDRLADYALLSLSSAGELLRRAARRDRN